MSFFFLKGTYHSETSITRFLEFHSLAYIPMCTQVIYVHFFLNVTTLRIYLSNICSLVFLLDTNGSIKLILTLFKSLKDGDFVKISFYNSFVVHFCVFGIGNILYLKRGSIV